MSEDNKDKQGQEGADYLTGKDGVNSGGAAREGEDKATKTASSQGATNDDTPTQTEEKQAS